MNRDVSIKKLSFFFLLLVGLGIGVLFFHYKQKPAESAGSSRVSVIVYNPTLSNGQDLITFMGWNNPSTLSSQIVSAFSQDTGGYVDYSIVETIVHDEIPVKADGFQYTPDTYLACLDNSVNCHFPDYANYVEMLNDNDICTKVNSGQVDEVWIWGAPYFGFYESRLMGPNGFWYNSPPEAMPGCNELVPVMGFNYERDLELALHDWGHRIESTMSQVYGGWSQNTTDTRWAKFALNDFQSPSYNYSGCGSAHYPPNATSDYQYNSSAFANSTCDSFYDFPFAGEANQVTSLNCNAWGCNGLGYLRWWFRHIPRKSGVGVDRVLLNWWVYILNPSHVYVTYPVGDDGVVVTTPPPPPPIETVTPPTEDDTNTNPVNDTGTNTETSKQDKVGTAGTLPDGSDDPVKPEESSDEATDRNETYIKDNSKLIVDDKNEGLDDNDKLKDKSLVGGIMRALGFNEAVDNSQNELGFMRFGLIVVVLLAVMVIAALTYIAIFYFKKPRGISGKTSVPKSK